MNLGDQQKSKRPRGQCRDSTTRPTGNRFCENRHDLLLRGVPLAGRTFGTAELAFEFRCEIDTCVENKETDESSPIVYPGDDNHLSRSADNNRKAIS